VPSDEDPYSPERLTFAAEEVGCNTREFTYVALDVPFGTYWNSVSGAA
jgi:hypothetical protein